MGKQNVQAEKVYWVRTRGKKSGANRKILVVYMDNNLSQVGQKVG